MDTSAPVLVVDDSLAIRNLVVKHLNALGFANVDVAEDGNVRKSGDVVGGPGKSYLFFLTACPP